MTYDVGNAAFPIVIGDTGHLGIVLAVLAVVLVWWLLFRTTLGLRDPLGRREPDAARYAGMRPEAADRSRR